MILKAGDSIGSCTVVQPCGNGTFGTVYLAEDAIGRRLAVKVVPRTDSLSERELAGLKNYKDCRHANLLAIHHIEITDSFICCTMDVADDLNRGQGEYLADTLGNRIRKSGRRTGQEIHAMLEDLLQGLEYLHQHGLVHRDIKPDNILWVNGRAVLADAGLIAPSGKGSLAGSPGFISPQVLNGDAAPSPADDFYALGKVIYCALTGLPVRSYPSLPQEVTLRMDVALGYAFRTACSKRITSADAFRKLLADKKTGIDRKTIFTVVIGILAAVVIAGLILLPGEKPAAVETVFSPSFPIAIPENRVPAKRAAVETVSFPSFPIAIPENRVPEKRAAEKIPEKTVLELLKKTEHEQLAHLEALLSCKGIENAQLFRDLGKLRRNGRNFKDYAAYKLYWFDLRYLFVFHREIPPEMLMERQEYWRKRTGDPQKIYREMLATDPVMQYAAFELLIRDCLQNIFTGKQLSAADFQADELKRLINTQRSLIP
ncbi:MAG: protein kinase [Lentisphaeria bacterium]|nr:protein kinase [Lentisphaeria bacterium]